MAENELPSDRTAGNEERIIDVDELDPTNATTLDDIYDMVIDTIKNSDLGEMY